GLSELEKNGGIVASNVESGKQWDSPYGWAPQNFFAVHGLNRYGYAVEASRIADKWARTTERIHRRTGLIYEKVDVVRADQPIETGEKYETQSGFLWSNAVYLLFLTD